MEQKEKQYSGERFVPPAANHFADGILLSHKPGGEDVEWMVTKMQYMQMPSYSTQPRGHRAMSPKAWLLTPKSCRWKMLTATPASEQIHKHGESNKQLWEVDHKILSLKRHLQVRQPLQPSGNSENPRQATKI